MQVAVFKRTGWCYRVCDLLFLFFFFFSFFFNDTATTQIYTLSLHDALPIYPSLSKLQALTQAFRDYGRPEQTSTVEQTSSVVEGDGWSIERED